MRSCININTVFLVLRVLHFQEVRDSIRLSTITAQVTVALFALLSRASRSPTAPETISMLQSQWPENWSLKGLGVEGGGKEFI